MVFIPINGHLLYMSARPGHHTFPEETIQDYKSFMAEIGKKRIALGVVILSFQELKEHYGGLNLCDYYRRNGVECLHYPVQDRGVPGNVKSFHSVVEVAWNRLKKENILIHCSAGIGRSGMVAAGVLIYGGERPGKAVARVRKVRPGAVKTPEQRDFLDEYYDFVTGKKEGRGAAR